MFDIITKEELFQYLRDGVCDSNVFTLKHVQDAFIQTSIGDVSGKRILELGGGVSRILPLFAKKNECWNADRFEGLGNGPAKLVEQKGIKTVPAYIGEFDERFSENYFDFLFSISVLEHLDVDQLKNSFLDGFRILKKGGIAYHAVDLVLSDDAPAPLLEMLLSVLDSCREKFEYLDNPAMDRSCTFRCRFVTLPDMMLWLWDKDARNPLRHLDKQIVSLKIGLRKL